MDQHGLNRDTVTAYVDAIIRGNQTETADEIGVSRDTVNRYKKAFAAMTAEERARILTSLFHERHHELIRGE